MPRSPPQILGKFLAMNTRNGLLSSLCAILLAAFGVLAVGAPPATAALAPPVNQYVALGDSFAAGQGAGPYLNACLQSSKGYAALLDAVKGINLLRNASCHGATTVDVNTTQLFSLRGTTLVTLTVGGNDLHAGEVAATCITAPVACTAAVAAARLRLPALAVSLAATYARISAAAPNARILVTGYPYLFQTPPSDPFGLISSINAGTTALNTTIQRAVGRAGENFHFVGVTGAFAGHGIGSADPWVHFGGPDVFHPNAAGYVAYEHALRAVLSPPAVRNNPGW
jgi:lysophospholipase L1-like esterase